VAIEGLGERLGLYGALASSGTRSIVAPAWDIVADAVIPILDDALERYADGAPIARAVHDACTQAATQRPVWMAWALALEGDWR
jgi:hypothetical protein